MAKIIQGELMPPEIIQCDCCNTTLRFGLGECPNCLARIIYNRNTPSNVIKQCALFFVFPLGFVFLWIPELGHVFGWPIVVAVSTVLGGMLAKWGFAHMWPKRNAIKPRFYRRTLQGYSTKSIDDEYAESMKPLLAMFAVPFGLAVVFVSNWVAHLVLGLLDADTGDLAFRIGFIISILMFLGSAILAIRLGLPDKLRSKKRFFA